MRDRSDLNVNLLDMPTSVRGRTVPNADGSYSVFINSRLCDSMCRMAYEHEVSHIERGDFDCDCERCVQEIESESHCSVKKD